MRKEVVAHTYKYVSSAKNQVILKESLQRLKASLMAGWISAQIGWWKIQMDMCNTEAMFSELVKGHTHTAVTPRKFMTYC